VKLCQRGGGAVHLPVAGGDFGAHRIRPDLL